MHYELQRRQGRNVQDLLIPLYNKTILRVSLLMQFPMISRHNRKDNVQCLGVLAQWETGEINRSWTDSGVDNKKLQRQKTEQYMLQQDKNKSGHFQRLCVVMQ